MAFKMKGPSMQAGTSAHRSALKEIGDSLERMNRGRKASPVKEDDASVNEEKIKKQQEKERKRKEKDEKRKKKQEEKERKKREKEQYKKDLENAKKIKKEADKKLNEKRKQQKKEQKEKDLQDKRNKKIVDTVLDVDKPGTVVSRTAKKIGKGVKEGAKKVGKWVGKGVKGKVADIKQNIQQRKEERQYKKDKWNEMSVEDRIDARKEKRSKIADNLEYIFLDGKRPEEAAYRRKHGYYRDDDENKLDSKDNNANEEINKDDVVETKYNTLQSDAGDPYQYRYDAATDTYQYKGPNDDDFKSHEKGSKGDNAIRKRYANK